MFAPESDIRFLQNAEVDPTMNNFRDFPDKAAQANYFIGKTKFSYSKCRVIGTAGFSGTIAAPIGGGVTIDSYYDCNYMMYKNSGISGKWFYAYLGTPEPLNAGTCMIPYTIDQWQTWAFDVGVDQCFVEREIPADDTIGSNVTPEDVDTGEFVMCPSDQGGTDLVRTTAALNASPCALIAYTFFASEEEASTYIVNEITNGLKYEFPGLRPVFTGGYLESGVYQANFYAWIAVDSNVDTKVGRINYLINKLVGQGQVDAIRWIKMVPRFLLHNNEYQGGDPPTSGANTTYPINKTISAPASPATISGYTPECNKLFTQQFNYLLVSNGSGATQEMGYEFFAGRQPSFTIFGMLGDDPSMMLAPVGYKCAAGIKNYMYTLDISGFPSGSFSYAANINEYNQNRAKAVYATQNALQTASGAQQAISSTLDDISSNPGGFAKNLASNVANAVSSGFNNFLQAGKNPEAALNTVGRTVGGVFTAASSVAGSAIGIVKDAVSGGDGSLPYVRTPNTIVGAAGGDISFAIGQKTFTEFRLQITEQYARKIDSYFKAYGYKINTIKQPDLSSRPYWNYVKCVSPAVHGNAPYEAKLAIAQIMTNGVRVWHPSARWMDFSQRNKA